MPADPSLSARLIAWCDRQNARDDEVQRARPSYWHVGKIVMGVLFIVKGAAYAVTATGVGGFALAALFAGGGSMFAYDGIKMLRERQFARRAAD